MPLVWKIALGVIAGGVVGYVFSRLFYGGENCSLGGNRPLMVTIGAVVGVLLGTVAFRGGAPALGEALTTSKQFREKVLKADKPVVVDFYAMRCPPCRKLLPVLTKLEEEYEGRLVFFRVDVDKAPGLAQQYGIRGIPTLLLYMDGEEVHRILGGRPEEVLRQHFDALLGH
jgi:thioredoxin 1